VILTIDPKSPVPPYAQVRDQIATMAGAGVLPAGARLPAIRHLAADLGVAPNTVARAYRELETAGVVATRGRHGTVIAEQAPASVADRRAAVDDAAKAYVLEAARRGLDLDQALDAVRAAFGGIDEHRRFT
jgi:DNA-binding transcriptional regulator YhcF (GntR family)